MTINDKPMKGPQRILVTGGAGFIGSHTVDMLLAAGHEVVVFDNLSTGKLEHLNLTHENVEFIEGDILEYHYLAELVASCQAVLHLAAIVSVPESISNPIYTFQVNTQGTLHVLQAIKEAKRPIRLVYASSAAVYGNPQQLPCDDVAPLVMPPISPYGLHKCHCEQYADIYARLHGIPSLGLRYFNVYGLRQDPSSPYSGVISRYLEAYHTKSPLKIHGDGEQTRDYIHIQDVARANVMALESGASGAINIATGKPASLLQIIDIFSQVGPYPAQTIHEEPRHGDIRASYATIQKAKDSISFEAQIGLQQGLSAIIQKEC